MFSLKVTALINEALYLVDVPEGESVIYEDLENQISAITTRLSETELGSGKTLETTGGASVNFESFDFLGSLEGGANIVITS